MSIWLAADVGGTKISAAAFDGEKLICRHQEATRPERGAEAVVQTLIDVLRSAADECGQEIKGIGIACPGPLSPSQGVVIKAPMLQWENVPLAKLISDAFGLPALLENDANAAAYGEYRLGAGKGSDSMAYITVSTGVGCGLVLDGKVVEGAHEGAGEIGHLVIEKNGNPCPCGRRGCLETYASGTAIGKAANQIRPGTDARMAAELARNGEEEFKKLFENAGDALGMGVAALKQLMDIGCFVFGGSVTQSMDLFAPALIHRVQESAYFADEPEKWLKKAELGADCGLYGAGLLAMERFE